MHRKRSSKVREDGILLTNLLLLYSDSHFLEQKVKEHISANITSTDTVNNQPQHTSIL